MEKKEPRRRGPKEKPVPQKNSGEYTAAELMRTARQKAGKTLSETGRELECNPQYLNQVERGRKPVSLSIARQYEQLFGQEPGQIIKTIYERPHKRRNQQEPPKKGG
jgi:transcriptional regulator with XRE-family HTH domain